MRRFLAPAALALGLMFVPATAHASWLSEAWHAWRGDQPVVTYDPGYPYYAPSDPYYTPGYSYYTPGYYVAPSYPTNYWSSPSWYPTYRYPAYYGSWYRGHGHDGHGYYGHGHHGHGHHH